MIFRIILKTKPQKFLDRMLKTTALRITSKLKEIISDPFRYLKHFEGQKYYKLRIGNYRALISVNIEEKLLVVEVLDKRGRIYK